MVPCEGTAAVNMPMAFGRSACAQRSRARATSVSRAQPRLLQRTEILCVFGPRLTNATSQSIPLGESWRPHTSQSSGCVQSQFAMRRPGLRDNKSVGAWRQSSRSHGRARRPACRLMWPKARARERNGGYSRSGGRLMKLNELAVEEHFAHQRGHVAHIRGDEQR